MFAFFEYGGEYYVADVDPEDPIALDLDNALAVDFFPVKFQPNIRIAFYMTKEDDDGREYEDSEELDAMLLPLNALPALEGSLPSERQRRYSSLAQRVYQFFSRKVG